MQFFCDQNFDFFKTERVSKQKAKGQVVGDFIQLHTDSVVGFVKMSNYNNSNNVSSVVLGDDMGKGHSTF